MSETKRGTVLLLQHGDPEISGAIAEGMLAARARVATPLEPEQIEVVQAEIDRQRIVASLVRVAVNNTKTPEDYANMTTKARGMYAAPVHRGRLRRLGDKLLTGYALLCYAVAEAYHRQDGLLGARR